MSSIACVMSRSRRKNSRTQSARSSAALRYRSNSRQALLQNIITQKLYNLPADYWDTYPQKVSAITAADVQNAAKKYLDHGQLAGGCGR